MLRLNASWKSVLACGVCVSVLAIMPAAGRGERPSNVVQKELEEARAKVEQLEREARQAERRAARAEEVSNMKQEAVDRLQQLREELRDLQAPQDGDPPSQAWQDHRRARVAIVKQLIEAVEAVSVLDGADDHDKAHRLVIEREILDAKWSDELDPVLERTARLADLQQAARESGKGVDLLSSASKLLEQYARDAAAEQELRAKRMRAHLEIELMMEQAEMLMEQ